ncbi:MAG: DUF2207 domain-containing protein [Robiginitomaculum sp.]
MFKSMRVLLWLLAAAFITALPAQARERITNFDTHIEVLENGDIIVTETIDIIAEGRQIKRGIFREIPRFLVDDEGYKLPQRYKVLNVTLDGEREHYKTSKEDNIFRIRIGRKSKFLETGAHQYAISYRASNQIRYGETADELYWNVTGTYWDFPMENVNASVALPKGFSIADVRAYTGAQGEKGRDYETRNQPSGINFITTRPLRQRENMTISVSVAKGLIAAPTRLERGLLFWLKNGSLIFFSLSLFAITVTYIRTWSKVGRNPPKEPVFPRYAPPKGYSPAATGYIYRRGVFDSTLVVSALMNLALKNDIKIDAAKDTVISRADYSADGEGFADEKRFLKGLFKKKDIITLDGESHPKFYAAQKRLSRYLSSHYSDDYHNYNLGYSVTGVFFSIFAVIISAFLLRKEPEGWMGLLILALIIVNVIYMFLIPAPTKKGEKIHTEIEGFKLYLKTAEKGRLNVYEVGGDAPPPMSAEHYQRFLPYAIALDVEKPWTKYFEKTLPAIAKNFAPHGVSGDFGSGQSLSRSTRNMVSSIGSSASSAAPQSSGSSGSGGGGSSGGGGGGGGGGGW